MADALPTPDAPLPDDPAVLQGMIRELLAALAAERHDRQQLENRLDLLRKRPAKDRWGSGGYGGRGRCSAGAWELRVGGALGLGPDVGQ